MNNTAMSLDLPENVKAWKNNKPVQDYSVSEKRATPLWEWLEPIIDNLHPSRDEAVKIAEALWEDLARKVILDRKIQAILGFCS